MPVSRGVGEQPLVLGQGGPDEQYTESGGAAHPGIRRRLHATDLSSFRCASVGRHSDHGTAYSDQSVANGLGAGPPDILRATTGSSRNDAGQPVLSRCQFVRSAAGGSRQEDGATPQEGPETACAKRGREGVPAFASDGGVGTVAVGGASKCCRDSGTGSRMEKAWFPFAGSLSTISAKPTATSISTPPIRR